MTQERKEVGRVRAGVRTVTGTDWPVEHIMERVHTGNNRAWWEVTIGLCNGVPERAEQYSTHRAAKERFAKLTGGTE